MIEVPYILVQTALYVAITYPMIGYNRSAYKVLWYFYTTFCTFLYFVYLGMLMVAVSSNLQVASILASAIYTVLNLFSGFLMPGPVNLSKLTMTYPSSKQLSAIQLFLQHNNLVLVSAENTKVVDLVLLDLPNVVVIEWLLNFTVWRYGEGDNHIRRKKTYQFLPRRILRFSKQPVRPYRCCSYCFSNSLCISICILYWEAKVSEALISGISTVFLSCMQQQTLGTSSYFI